MLRAELETGVIFLPGRRRFHPVSIKIHKKQLLMEETTGLAGSRQKRRFLAVSGMRPAG
jgi:hypothetical protein